MKPLVVMGTESLRAQDLDFRVRALLKALPRRMVPAFGSIETIRTFFSLEANRWTYVCMHVCNVM